MISCTVFTRVQVAPNSKTCLVFISWYQVPLKQQLWHTQVFDTPLLTRMVLNFGIKRCALYAGGYGEQSLTNLCQINLWGSMLTIVFL